MNEAPDITDLEREHAQMQSQLAVLNDPQHCARDVEDCATCPASLLDPCRNAFDSYCVYLLNYMLHHFRKEEILMQGISSVHRVLNDSFMEHIEDHADIMERLSRIIRNNSLPGPGRKSLHRLISDWLENHHVRHDAKLFVSWCGNYSDLSQ